MPRPKSSKRTRPNGVVINVVRGARMSGWYNRLNLGNSRGLTWSASMRCSGDIPKHVVEAWWAYADKVRDEVRDLGYEESEVHIQTALDTFADDLDTLWPEWNQAPKTGGIKVGDRMSINMGPRRGIKTFTVKSLPQGRQKNTSVQFDGDSRITGLPQYLMASATPVAA